MEPFSYRTPAYLISFYRSGSNFVKNVIVRSTGFKCHTIYDPNITPYPSPEDYLLLKSHAPSYMHLLSELGRFAPTVGSLPHKIVLLWRDPRDAFISLFDWFQARHRTRITPDELLFSMDWGYASAGMGVIPQIETYRLLVRHWYTHGREIRNVHELRYEDLLKDRNHHFGKMWEFLELDSPIRTEAYEELVQQLPSDREQRGRPGTWKRYYTRYRDLVDKVNHELADEIRILGYEFP